MRERRHQRHRRQRGADNRSRPGGADSAPVDLPRQRDRAEDTGLVAERRGDEVAVDVLAEQRRVEIAADEFAEPCAHHRQQRGPVQHAPARDHALRRDDEHDAEDAERDIFGFERPRGVIIRELRRRFVPALRDRRTARKALPAIAVDRAHAGKRVARGVVRKPQVADLWMDETVQRAPVDQQAGADPGADRHVAQALGPAAGTPAVLAERRGGHVEVKRDRYL